MSYTLTDTRAIPHNWAGGRGRFSEAMVRKAVPDYAERTSYLSGPPAMVRAHAALLRGMGVRRADIKQDLFAGLA